MRRARAALRPIFRFLEPPTKRTRRYFRNRMTARRRTSSAGAPGSRPRKAERIEALYAEALARLEARRARCAPLLAPHLRAPRRPVEPLVYVYDRGR